MIACGLFSNCMNLCQYCLPAFISHFEIHKRLCGNKILFRAILIRSVDQYETCCLTLTFSQNLYFFLKVSELNSFGCHDQIHVVKIAAYCKIV